MVLEEIAMNTVLDEHRRIKAQEMSRHVTILAIINIAWSAMGLLVALIVFTAVTGGGMLSGDVEIMTITTTIGSSIASLLTLMNLPGLLGGIALLKRLQWGRILTLVVGFFHLVAIPFGTVLGIYTLWVLLSEDPRLLFEQENPKEQRS
ncbi:MAG TPA: hypothetical protein VLA34_10570 [Candidatus Krumholzibacterium sp.]|nr:hypothetical protein [Candidatus Krumholzibacterium sp.]